MRWFLVGNREPALVHGPRMVHEWSIRCVSPGRRGPNRGSRLVHERPWTRGPTPLGLVWSTLRHAHGREW